MKATTKIIAVVLIVIAATVSLNASVLPVEYTSGTYTPGQNFTGDLSTYQPSSVNMFNLDHYKYYTWGIDASDIAADAAQITAAELVFKSIKNYNSSANVLYVNLLDSASIGLAVGNDNQGGGNYFAAYELVGQWSNDGNRVDLVFHFDENLLSVLRQYVANDGVVGFGLDPDCHYYNCGVTFAVETIPEPATFAIMLMGAIAIFKRK